MKEIIITTIIQKMLKSLDNAQLQGLKQVLEECFEGYDVTCVKTGKERPHRNNNEMLDAFINSKRVEGCSEKSLDYYQSTLSKALDSIGKNVLHITTDDLRKYLTDYQNSRPHSKVTIDNVRRVLSSFFSWLEAEDHIVKSPVRRIHKIKTTKVVKETFTDEELQSMKDHCEELRNLAIIDMLSSTGMRIGEMVLLNKSDIDFSERECVVLGKGDKQRIVYFDAESKLHLKDYLKSRNDNCEALFVGLRKPNKRLSIGAIETMLREFGVELGINRVHPHKFRRTLATMAIDKGMPIEQLQHLLGHQKIDTTLQYAMVKESNVKIAHRRYIG